MHSEDLPKKLKQLRKAKKLTQVALAQALNIEQSTYSGYERGRHFPGPDMLARIAEFYDIDLGILMTLSSQDSEPRHKKNAYHYPPKDERSYRHLSASELSGYLSYATADHNKQRLKGLTEKEVTLLYCFDRLSKRDQDDFIEFLKIRISRK